jgi:cellulose synthase/poly-beta-1,6-N-acetylglucosamine synthase-like glycosyltransferase
MMHAQTMIKEATASVSVGICATTELENTSRLVDEILDLGDGRINLLEILVATPNRQLARELAVQNPRVVVLFEEKREGKISALNKIIEHASGEILVLACADIKIARNAIPRLVQDLTRHPEWGAVDSIVELVNGDELFMDRVSNLLWETNNATLDELDSQDRLGQITGNLLAVRRGLIEKLPDVINDDEYFALKIHEKGFQVKRAYGAEIWIGGPRTPADYLFQRSRVLQGHLQLIQRFGKMPTTFEFEVLLNPQRYLKLLVRTVARLGYSYMPPLIIAGFLELVSFQVAVFSSLIKRGRKPWRIVESTKQF